MSRRFVIQFRKLLNSALDEIFGSQKVISQTRQQIPSPTFTPEYQKKESILTNSEKAFYKVLVQAVENKYQVFTKVRLDDFISLSNKSVSENFHQDQIFSKYVDFLLCNNSLTPLLVVELDNSNHKYSDIQKRDKFKDDIILEIGLPILRVEVQPGYSVRYLQDLIEWKLKEKSERS